MLLAILLIQAQPVPRVSARPNVVRVAPEARKARMVGEGRALLARAETVRRGYAPARGQPSKAELDTAIDSVKSDLDSMSEMGEMESLRLQMTMDRMAKLMETLSNLLKKISDTQQGIVQNIK